jgi:hypothetical protein
VELHAQGTNPFQLPGRWQRGCLHCHSTGSDGALAPEAVADWYAEHGYDFLAITDHNRVTRLPGYQRDGFTLVQGVEMTAGRTRLGASFHLVALDCPPDAPPSGSPAAESIAWARSAGGIVYAAHPHWTGATSADLLGIEGCFGVEVYNGATVLDSCKGEAAATWDELLAAGRTIWGVATDDAHFKVPDYGLGWVMVRAEGSSPHELCAALAAGAFYSSAGPALHDVSVDGLTVRVRCSPVVGIYCLAPSHNRYVRSWDGSSLTEAEFRLRGVEPYVRVQVVDHRGRSAWSNPYRVEP